ncbi:MAG: hypothetical protein HKN45_00345 [Flavobacteriales bacterium]|nr:hypothetical protein [Flavobacteriales bacterium]
MELTLKNLLLFILLIGGSYPLFSQSNSGPSQQYSVEVADVLAGNDTSICSLSFQLQGSATDGTWQWFALGPGSATYDTDPGDPAATITVSEYGSYDLLWNYIGDNGCDSSGVVNIEFLPLPIAEAPDTLIFCQLEDNFLSATPADGGQWSILSGSFLFNINVADSPIQNLSGFGEYLAVWTVSNAGCSDSDTTLLRYIEPEEADILTTTNQICGSSIEFSAANDIGFWSCSNPNLSFSPLDSQNTLIQVSDFGGYTINWTVGDAGCSSTDSWNIAFFDSAQVDIQSVPDEICSSDILSLNGSALNNISQQWSTNGDGVFSEPGNLDTEYTIGSNDSINGSITITLSADGLSVCPVVEEEVSITVIGATSVNASSSSPSTFCSDGNIVLNGNAVNTSSILWSTSGDGQFLANPNMEDPTYFPGQMDIDLGTATLIISGEPLSTACTVAADVIEILIVDAPSSGSDSLFTTCLESEPFSLLELFGPEADQGGTLTDIDGSGAFDGIDFNPSDAGEGLFEFSYSVEGTAPCVASESFVTIEVIIGLNAGTDIELNYCQSSPIIDLITLLENGADLDGDWLDTDASGGLTGSLFNPNIVEVGEYTITYLLGAEGICPADSTIFTISVNEGPDAGIVGDITVCESTDELELFLVLNGSPNLGGQWIDNSGSDALDNGIFSPGLSGPGEFLFEYIVSLEGCESDSSSIIVEVIPAPAVTIETTGALLCSDEILAIDASSENANNYSWSSSGSGIFMNAVNEDIEYEPSSDDFDQGTITLSIIAEGGSGCALAIDSIQVQLVETPISNAGSDFGICGLQTDLDADLESGIGIWTADIGLSLSDESSPFSQLTAENYGSYSLTWTVNDQGCIDSDDLMVEFWDSPDTISTSIECINTNTEYILSFDITGGDIGSYSVDGGGTLIGNLFTSEPIPTGYGYNFSLSDINDCSPLIVAGQFSCTSLTSAGSFSIDTIHGCIDSSIEADFNNDEFLDENDLLQFIIHDDANEIGNILALSNEPSFDPVPALLIGEVYYISSIAGDDDGTGNVDLSSSGSSISSPTPLIIHTLPEAYFGSDSIGYCPGESVDVELNFEGNGPFVLQFTYLGNLFEQTFNDSTGELNISQSGDITLISIADTYCANDITNQIIIEEFTLPTMDIADSLITCSGAIENIEYELQGQGPWTFELNINGQSQGPQTTLENYGQLVPNSSGIYLFQEISDSNCTNSQGDSIWVDIIDSPFADAGEDVVVCPNEPFIIGSESEIGVIYSWTNGAFLDDENSSTTVAIIPNETSIPIVQTLTLTSSINICSSQDEIIVTINPEPLDFGIEGDEHLCLGDTAMLSAFGGVEYNWVGLNSISDTISSETLVYPMEDTTFEVEIINEFGCGVITEMQISVIQPPQVYSSIELIDPCPPASVLIFNDTPGSEFVECQWAIPNAQIIQEECAFVEVTMPSEGIYLAYLQLTDEFGCRSLVNPDTISIKGAKANFSFFPETPTPDTEFLQTFNISQNVDSSLWTLNGDSIASGYSAMIELEGLRPDYYELCLSIITDQGCLDTLCKKFELENNVSIWVPNTFTPDEDGINDEFRPIINGKEYVEKYLIQVFDRRGKKLFESQNMNDSWKADSSNGEFFMQSAYQWVVTMNVFGEPYPRKYQGMITLLK